MKVLKNATQKNVMLDKDYYSRNDLIEMLDNKDIFFIDEDYDISFNSVHVFDNPDEVYRVSLNDVNELKVVYNKTYECYETVAVMKNGKTLHVEI